MAKRKVTATVDVGAAAVVVPPSLDHVVGIGSSAGGLEALQELVGALTPGGRVAYVLAQHLSPDHESLIVDLLAHATPLVVVHAVDGAQLQPDVIVVGPPKHDIEVVGDRLHVFEPTKRVGPSPSVDVLFESIAAHWGANGVAVVLSGTGSDGAQGARTVRSMGGLTIAQSPESARFDAMPRAAITLSSVDLVLTPAEIGERLSTLNGSGGDWAGESLPEPEPVVLTTVAAQLKRMLGIDFSRYKESTLRRQVQRRMAIRQVNTVEDYLPILAADAAEAESLARHLLVTVTSFFRDPDAFDALREHLAIYVARSEGSEPMRVWVPGCATGEEVYTIAMLCAEALGHPVDLERRLKIFGTDLDDASLAVARRAVYPLSSADKIPEALRATYVTIGPRGVEIANYLRSCVVFARHDVGENPPFSRIDLVSCRNTLIYFTTPLQEHVLDLIRYALLPGGLMLLGSSETVGTRTHGFVPLDAQQRIFARTGQIEAPAGSRTHMRVPGIPSASPTVSRVIMSRDTVPEQHVALLEALVRSLGHPCLVLDENHDLVEVVGDVSPFCRVPQGPLSASAGSFLRPELQAESRALFLMVRSGSTTAVGRLIRLDDAGLTLRLEARPLRLADHQLTVLSFVPVPDDDDHVGITADRDDRFDLELERLERELLASQDAHRQSMADLEAVNEELEASSEELQASSEELQSSNEELEASNEELQATNQELVGLNDQLRLHGEEKDRLNVDLENIQSSSNQGMVIVDLDLRVTRFTPLAVRVFALAKNDVGSLLSSVPMTMPVVGLREALQGVVTGQQRRTLEARGDDQSYLVQVLPYLDGDGICRGAIITLTEVTELISLRRTADTALAEFTRVTNALDEAVWKRDLSMSRVEYASDRIRDLTGWSPADVMEHPELLDQCIDPDDLDRVRSARLERPDGWSVEYQFVTRDGRKRNMIESAVVVRDTDEHFVVGTLADITDRIEIEHRAADLSLVFEAVYNSRAFGAAVLDAEARVVMANTAFCALVGYDMVSVVGVPMLAFHHPDERGHAPHYLSGEPPTAGMEAAAYHLSNRDGNSLWVAIDLRPLARPVGLSTAMVIVQNVTQLKESNDLLARQASHDEAVTGLLNRNYFGEALSHELDRCRRDATPLALVWLDLDRFKEVNDQHGHEAGDTVLKAVADRLIATVRSHDIVGRLGGDEFGIIVSGYDRIVEVEHLLDRVLDVLQVPISVADSAVVIGGSLGVARYPEDSNDADGLMRAADAAMYSVKVEGGLAYGHYSESMNAASEGRRAMREAMAAAITMHDFELFYQPITFTVGGDLWGAEALIRWHRDDRVVAAGEFIEFAEESGQIRQLGQATFALLRRDLETLRNAGHGAVSVSVNMSVRQLEDRTFTDQLKNWPAAAGLDGLVVEVVESVFLPGNWRAIEALHALVDQGAKISIDDYGSGFSNLVLMKELSPTFIKMDQTLIALGDDRVRSRSLLKSAIEMSHALGASVVVEGVEEEAQRDLAVELGAEMVQGYLIARPMPLPDLISWMDAHGTRR